MAGSVNKVILIGNLGADPKVRTSQDGNKSVQFPVATSETWNDKSTGERKERTEWHKVVVFNDRLADVCEKYLRKGAKVHVDGQLQTRKWTDDAGVERFITEVILSKYRGEITMLDSRQDRNSGPSEHSYDQGYNVSKSPSSQSSVSHDLDDDIPF
ncbi:MAG: single-stranded DNA-binding protein [Janthinobacterium lividum]